MHQPLAITNDLTPEGFPFGGTVNGRGLNIAWQKGPLRSSNVQVEPNGAFVEDVIYAALQRIEHYNTGPFRCRENSLAITKLEEALHWLNARTARRVDAGTEGTWEGT